MRKKKKLKPGDDSEEETDSDGEQNGAGQGTSLDIKRGIMQRLRHLDSRDNHRCPCSSLLLPSDILITTCLLSPGSREVSESCLSCVHSIRLLQG